MSKTLLNIEQIDGLQDALDAAGGSGTVTAVSVVTANGISGSVANPTTTPAITITLNTLDGGTY